MVSIRRLIAAALACLCAAVGIVAFSTAGAQATITHKYLSQITEIPTKGPPPGNAPVSSPGPLEQLGGLAVDGSELYVADSFSNSRLDKFNAATGAFVSQYPQLPRPVYDLRQGVAVGHGTGETEVYVTGDEEGPSGTTGLVAVYGAAGSLQGVWKGADTPAGAFSCFECGPRGEIAVDNSANLIGKGRVYVSVPGQNVVDVFEPQAGGGEKYLTQLTGSEPAVHFAEVQDVAVDQSSGDVLVVDGGKAVDIFEPAALGEYTLVRRLTGTPAGSFADVTAVAVDGGSGDVYAIDGGAGAIDQFTSTGAYAGHLTGVGTPAGAFGSLAEMAVDPATHDVYVDDGASVDVFGPSIVIPDVLTESPLAVKARSATLEGKVDPDEAGPATCSFEWGTSTSFGKVAPCEPEGVAQGDSPVAVHAALSELQPDTTYYYRLRASNANGTNPGEAAQDREFATPGPGISEQAASIVTSDSTTLSATIDPDGAATSYYFQYGTSSSYGSAVPAAPGRYLGSGAEGLAVNVHLQGLEAGVTYHYRVVAVSEPNGELVTATGPDATFTTQAVGGEFTLPDGRSWEMVTPPDKQGAGLDGVGDEQGADIQAASDGSAITYVATAPFVANPAGSRSPEGTQIFSSRLVPGSWETQDIATPYHEGASSLTLGNGGEYKLFSSDLSVGVLAPNGYTPLPPLPAGSEKTMYLRTTSGGYKALVTSANIPPGTRLDPPGDPDAFTLHFASATPDLSHVLIESSVPLTAKPGDTGGLYEWAEGQLQKVGILPDGELTEGELGAGFDNVDVRNAISTDGSRVIWSAHEGSSLYMRDMVRGETIAINAGDTQYRTASTDDSRVFFTSPERLTTNATAASNEEDLYEFEVTSAAGQPLAGKLVDLSVDANPGESADVLGVIGASEDGSDVYFVARGVLGDAAAHGAKPGANLYVERYEAGSKTWGAPLFVAGLSSNDYHSWGSETSSSSSIGSGFMNMISRVSPNGRYVAFMSQESLTGYDNRDAVSDVPDEEVFLYDSATGKLICASCDPTGARPDGVEGEATYYRLVDFGGRWSGRWFAANIPSWTSLNTNNALYQSRYLSNSGRLFFNSSDALVPADVNGQEDVYEYEPAGIGSCQGESHGQSASVVFSTSLEGCVGLISAGTSGEESAFMDASETGGDVFFLTSSKLVSQDRDTSSDLYDAHECTAAQPCAPAAAQVPPPCATGDACKPSPTPQPTIFGAPSSETFSGAGNVVAAPPAATPALAPKSLTRVQKLARALKACRKQNKSHRPARAKCEAKAKRKYAAKSSRVRESLSIEIGR